MRIVMLKPCWHEVRLFDAHSASVYALRAPMRIIYARRVRGRGAVNCLIADICCAGFYTQELFLSSF